MSVEQLSGLHQRYVELSDRFKAAWTFHQFLTGVNKVFANYGIGEHTVSFQRVYADLKATSKNLHTPGADQAREQLNGTARELEDRIRELLEDDAKLRPPLMRQFFDRVKRYDDKILVQLLKFYVFTRGNNGWQDDRLDKADFLLTRLGESLMLPDRESGDRHPQRFRETLAGVWKAIDREPPSDEDVEDTRKELRTLREAMEAIDSIEQFNNLGLVGRYRGLKHSLGDRLFFPDLAAEVVTNNLLLRRRIKEFYEREERRIAAEYQEVFELERGAAVDRGLDSELRSFRGEVEEYEKNVATKNVRLDEMARIRQRARHLIPKLRGDEDGEQSEEAAHTADGDGGESPEDTVTVAESTERTESLEGVATANDSDRGERTESAEDAEGTTTAEMSELAGLSEWSEGVPEEKPAQTLRIRTPHADVLAEPLRYLVRLLENSDWRASPRAVTETPEAKPLRLEPREVLAYRRLFQPERFDRQLEQFLLEAAALRIRISAEAEEIIGMIDLLGGDRDAEVYTRASATCKLASAFEQRFDHFISQALMMGDLLEARTLHHHRIRLLRDYTGLWLLVYG